MEKFEEKIGISFKNKDFIKRAFIHRSYINENRSSGLEHNERLEFLGDAVLELVITDYLYKRFPEWTEGEMTSLRSALVNADTCARVAENLGAGEFIMMSKGQAKDTGRAWKYILANVFEAIIGAIYEDQNYVVASEFILKNMAPLADEIIEAGSAVDSKTLFQEMAQEKTSTTPSYKTLKESGPDHDRHYRVGVYLGNELIGEGDGKSKQEAEQDAARSALEKKGWK